MSTATAEHDADPRNRHLSQHPELGAGPIPIEPYISEAYFELERERIFRRVWLNIGRIEQIPNPGDLFVKDLAVCRTSLVVVRQKDGSVCAFHNVCQHRGNKLVWESMGACKGALTCRYHAWTYDAASGRLLHASDEENIADFDKSKVRLKSVRVELWKGFIFVNFDERPKESLLDFLGETGRILSEYPFEEIGTSFVYEVDDKANWKILATSQEEGYHVPYVHAQSHGRAIPLDRNGHFRSDITIFGKHHIIATGPKPGYVPNRTETLTTKFISGFVDAFADPTGARGARGRTATFNYVSIFPNFHLLLLEGTYLAYSFWPIAVDRTMWEARANYMPPRNMGQRFAVEYGKCATRDIMQEDVPFHEQTQSVARSGGITQVHFHDEETTCRHTLKLVDDYVRGRV